MKKALLYIAFFDLLFLTLIFVSGLFSGIAGKAVYYLAFILPLAAAGIVKHREADFSLTKFKISPENLLLTLPAVAPTLAVIFFISWLTSLLLSRFGGTSATDVSGNIVLVIFTRGRPLKKDIEVWELRIVSIIIGISLIGAVAVK